ncbi:PREDICTED: sn1-specific diacylglycerol lipase beta isoform X2 [Myotis davidii]|uniref:sn1-specific diacylglycerol lipase beta isoform X2 n=1 Tax=Myotis davidii TaxID=225400 RepID=UPI000766FDDF|nr:PREDICTED: sn1-specific diacylglycerol lipase beta isoform X2 [Myotis davidii]
MVVLLVLLAVIVCTVLAIVCVSMRGTICNPGPRKSMSTLLYIRLALFLPEIVWAALGAMWVAESTQCDRIVVSAIIATVVVSWVIIGFTVVIIVVVFDPLGGKAVRYSSAGPSLAFNPEASQFVGGLRTAATSVWEKRMKLLCCCVERDDQAHMAFSSTAELFSTYFSEDDLDAELENCRHYMPIAAAAYGWPLYIYRNPFTGLCRIGGDCCRSRTTEYDVVGGDQLHCHFGSILRMTGLQHRDFIHISFHDKGISQAAKYLYRRLVSDGILSQAFSVAPEYRLVIIGHSLGAGAAALLAFMLRGAYPHVRCYAFSPPRGLLSKSLYEHSKDFTVSLVVGKDVVPRLSVTNMEDLKKKILRLIAHCNKPKYKILLRGCWYGLFGGNPDDLPTELDGGDHSDLTLPLLGEQSLLTRKSPGYRPNDSPLGSPTKYPPLYPPGRIIHLEEEGPSGRCSCYTAQYTAKWAHESEFSEILIGGKMLTDHMPDVLIRALDRVSNQDACISCPATGGSA